MPKHLLIECRNNNSERHELRKNLDNFGLSTLLTTKKGIVQYLQKTKEADMPEDDAGGWGQLKQD